MPALTDGDRVRLRELTEKDWVRGAVERDIDALLALCSDDFVYMPQDHPAVHGKERTRTYLQTFPDITHMTQSIESLSGDADLAVVRGSFEARACGRAGLVRHREIPEHGEQAIRRVAPHECLLQLGRSVRNRHVAGAGRRINRREIERRKP